MVRAKGVVRAGPAAQLGETCCRFWLMTRRRGMQDAEATMVSMDPRGSDMKLVPNLLGQTLILNLAFCCNQIRPLLLK